MSHPIILTVTQECGGGWCLCVRVLCVCCACVCMCEGVSLLWTKYNNDVMETMTSNKKQFERERENE